MNIEQMQELLEASLDSYGCGYFGEDDMPEDMVVVEDGDWTQDYKYQNQSTVYKCPEGNFFEVQNSRSGSPFTDWNYGDPSVIQVKPVEKVVTTTVWVGV